MVPVEKFCFCLVVRGEALAGMFAGTPEAAWDGASDLSKELHIVRKPHAFHTVLSCAPKMYDELWVGGKCMYKLEPVVADGGELAVLRCLDPGRGDERVVAHLGELAEHLRRVQRRVDAPALGRVIDPLRRG